jgi:phosphoserine phosphatase RsbU/P
VPFRDLRERLDAVTGRFEERPSGTPGAAPERPRSEGYWGSVQELFTRDVTQHGLRQLVEDAPESFRFFTRQIDFAALGNRPWYRRYPLAAWKVYLATAFRLSPARRILFAVAVPLLLLGWLRFAVTHGPLGPWQVVLGDWMLLAGTLFFLLLVLELRDKLALKGDLEIARQIQFGLLPFDPYLAHGTAICASMRPANTVGGDYFDFVELPEGRLAVVMADVAGKGMPAALLMALLQGSLRTLLTAGFRGADLVAKLNAHLQSNIPSNRLVTLFYGEFHPAEGALRYTNAGHNAPFVLRRDGRFERLPATDVALGVLDRKTFQEETVEIGEGERVFLFTDGVTEANDTSETEYGEARLAAFLAGHGELGDGELLEAVQRDVLAFCGSARPRDDMTLLVLARRT